MATDKHEPTDKSEAKEAEVMQALDTASSYDKSAKSAASKAETGGSPSDADPTDHQPGDGHADAPAAGPHHRLWQWFTTHKQWAIPGAIIVVLAVLVVIPMTRYLIAGTVIRSNFSVAVVDAQTGKPVSSATVTVAGKTAVTNSKGIATIHANVGNATVRVSKKYYRDTSAPVLVAFKQHGQFTVKFTATGRQVPLTVVNKISGEPAANITISAESTQAITDSKGEAVIVVPANKTEVQGAVSGKNYNQATVTIRVTAAKDPANTLAITPAGKLYFLSNASGKLDVVKADLDGQNRQTVLAGTGTEEKATTVLLASQDWKYLALLSERDGGNDAKLFLIDTTNDSLTTMDEGQAAFTLSGWSDHTFIYRVDRTAKQSWEPKKYALKSFNADTKKLATLDETAGGGSQGDFYGTYYTNAYILGTDIVYSVASTATSVAQGANAKAGLYAVKPDGSGKREIKTWPSDAQNFSIYLTTAPYEASSLYVASSSDTDHLYEYEDGSVKTVAGKKADDIYQTEYFTYLFSPSNKQTFWSESRDGKNTLFVGDAKGENSKQIASLSDYQTFGWFTDNYLLVSKNGSELFVLPATGLANGKQPLKVTDYYKPGLLYPGYGKGYGGF